MLELKFNLQYSAILSAMFQNHMFTMRILASEDSEIRKANSKCSSD